MESLVKAKYGGDYLKKKKIKKELAQISSELKKVKAQAISLEKRRAELMALLDEWAE